MRTYLTIILLLLVALGACTVTANQAPEAGEPFPTPTSHPYFVDNAENRLHVAGVTAGAAAPTVAAVFSQLETPLAVEVTATPSPTATPVAAATQPTPSPAPSRLITATVYAEGLAEGWTLEQSQGMDVDPASEAVVFDGERALAATPLEDFGMLYFTLQEDAAAPFPRDRVLGLSLQLSGGDNLVDLADLAVTVVGSNDFPFWVTGDNSVTNRYEPVFSETRLYYLGLNRALPPRTWARVELLLDERAFDPDFAYVTGFYIKNDEGFLNTFYIDDVSLLLLEQE